jgi:hypothetical protein
MSTVKHVEEAFALEGLRNIIAIQGFDAYFSGEVVELLPPKGTRIIGLVTDPPQKPVIEMASTHAAALPKLPDPSCGHQSVKEAIQVPKEMVEQ